MAKRILVVLEYFYTVERPIGGAERQIGKLAAELIAQGLEVTIVTGRWRWAEPCRETRNGVPVRRVFCAWGMFDIRGLRKFGHYLYLASLFFYLLWRHRRYDFIHCHSAMSSAYVVAKAGKLLRKKTLARPMASGPKWGDIGRMKSGEFLKGGTRLLAGLKEVDYVIALNADVITELRELGIEEQKIVPMPNGVEVSGIASKEEYSADPVTITFVGRMHPQKGVETLLAAFEELANSEGIAGIRLQFVGQGPLESELEGRVRERGLADSVSFLGEVSDVFPVLYASDVFALPSRAEGMSNALLEAMTCGLPCVVSDIPANSGVVEHERNGLLAAVDDPAAWTAALSRLIQDETLRRQLGSAAVKTVLENYSISAVAERYGALYERALATPTG